MMHISAYYLMVCNLDLVNLRNWIVEANFLSYVMLFPNVLETGWVLLYDAAYFIWCSSKTCNYLSSCYGWKNLELCCLVLIGPPQPYVPKMLSNYYSDLTNDNYSYLVYYHWLFVRNNLISFFLFCCETINVLLLVFLSLTCLSALMSNWVPITEFECYSCWS